jgi:sugar phosphate permease
VIAATHQYLKHQEIQMATNTAASPSAQQLTTSSERWTIPAILAITVVFAYLDRVNVSIALPYIAKDFGWTLKQTGEYGGYIFGAFFFSYGLANILLSGIAEKIGITRSLVITVACFCVVTMLTGYLAAGVVSLIVLRLVLGIAEGIHFPMMSSLVTRWFPPTERSRANSIFFSGISIANMTAPVVILPLIQWTGWRNMFLILGLVGGAICIPLILAKIRDYPTKQDVTFDLPPATPQQAGGKIWSTDFALWTLCGVVNGFFSFGVGSWQPTYFDRVHNLNFNDQIGALTIIYAGGVLGLLLAAWIGDKTGKRLIVAAVGYLIAAIAVYLCASATSATHAIVLLGLATVALGGFLAQLYAITQMLLPRNKIAVGTGLNNGLALLIGASLGPIVFGKTIAATGTFVTGLYVLAGSAALNFLLIMLMWWRMRGKGGL